MKNLHQISKVVKEYVYDYGNRYWAPQYTATTTSATTDHFLQTIIKACPTCGAQYYMLANDIRNIVHGNGVHQVI